MIDLARRTPSEKVLEAKLDKRIKVIETSLNAQAISFVGNIVYGLDNAFRDQVEGMARNVKKKKAKLAVILETEGGYIEVVERIVKTLRHHYNCIEFIVPDYAMSAGTVLVMSGDAIHMDYFSNLGPIDPQIDNKSGKQVSALGYLIQYNKLIEKADKGTLNTAEAAILINHFDQADLYEYEEARELSISLLREWLVKYKFKDWTKTQERNQEVTVEMRKDRATEIAEKLSDPDIWHTHGRGIFMDTLRRDMKLKIEDFGKNGELNDAIRAYCGLLRDYMERLQHVAVLHRRGNYVPLDQG